MPLFTGFVAHTVSEASFEGDPKTADQLYELTSDDARILASQMVGLPVTVQHDNANVTGKVVSSFVMPDGKFVAQVDVEDKTEAGKLVCDLIRKHKFDNFSLQHDRIAKKPIHLALCCKGARDNTYIFDTGLASSPFPPKTQTNDTRDKQNQAPEQTPQPGLVSASFTQMQSSMPSSSSSAAHPSVPGQQLPLIASFANSILQEASHATAQAGLGAIAGTDAAAKAAQQQHFMQFMLQQYQNAQQQQQQQQAQSAGATAQQAEQSGEAVSKDQLTAQAWAKLGMNGINTGAERAAMISSYNEQSKRLEAMDKELAQLKEQNKVLSERNQQHEESTTSDLNKMSAIIQDLASTLNLPGDHKTSLNCSDPQRAVHSAYPILCSASAQVKAQLSESDLLKKKCTTQEQTIYNLLQQLSQIRSLPTPSAPQQTPLAVPTPQQAALAQQPMYQQQLPYMAAPQVAPFPQQQQQQVLTPEIWQLLMNVAMNSATSSYSAPPQPAVAQPTQPAQQLVSASYQNKRQRTSFDDEGGAGYTFKQTPMAPDAAAFYSNIRDTSVSEADVMEYRRSIDPREKSRSDESSSSSSSSSSSYSANRDPMRSTRFVPVNSQANRNAKFNNDDDE